MDGHRPNAAAMPTGRAAGRTTKCEDKEEKLLGDELDDSFPASDPPASTQPVGKEPPAPKPRKPD